MLNRSIDGVIPRVPKRNLRDSRRATIVTLLYLSVSNSLSGRYWEPDQVLQWETQRTLFSSARATVVSPAKVNGVWPSSDAWLRAAL
jgi:hypothetical protein